MISRYRVVEDGFYILEGIGYISNDKCFVISTNLLYCLPSFIF